MRSPERIRRLRGSVAAIGIAAIVAACGSVPVTPAAVATVGPSKAAGSIGPGSDASAAAGSEPPGAETPPSGASPSGPAVPIDLDTARRAAADGGRAAGHRRARTRPGTTTPDWPTRSIVWRRRSSSTRPPTGSLSSRWSALIPGVFDEPTFRSWRDTFDEGVCLQAGGVGGHAETQIAGRTVYIGTCTGGVTTYHVRLAERNAIVSIWSLEQQPAR